MRNMDTQEILIQKSVRTHNRQLFVFIASFMALGVIIGCHWANSRDPLSDLAQLWARVSKSLTEENLLFAAEDTLSTPSTPVVLGSVVIRVPDPDLTYVRDMRRMPFDDDHVGDVFQIRHGQIKKSVRFLGSAQIKPGQGPCTITSRPSWADRGADCQATVWCNSPDGHDAQGRETWARWRWISICAKDNWEP